ncbi:MAG: sugar transferase [Bacteroidales bacterium]|jgi:lipopolysaccharide/colanic/teichoic acid biosynthesis glycosyltransferase|nr:sugar transferase [Bacteroidales bacterium]
MYKRYLKRILDLFLAFVALVLVGWLLLLAALFLHFANKGAGAFFLQERPGKDGRIFKIIKFKTMTDERDADGNLLPDAQRLTKVGRIVRSTSLDELPQLLNVLKGDMSLIGPRPLLVQYLPLYSPEQARRHEVRPGITGWAQVHGRNAITWQEKFKLDVWYVDHCTFATDLKVIWLTVVNVLKRKDINSSTSATMEFFTGNN